MFRGTCDAPGEGGAVGGCAHLMGAPPPQAIGKVPAATGPVAVTRASDDVARPHDPIATATDGAAGITFTAGTAFNLSHDACMALNELVRDPNGTSNSAPLSLNQGAFTSTAGKVTKRGGLRIDLRQGSEALRKIAESAP